MYDERSRILDRKGMCIVSEWAKVRSIVFLIVCFYSTRFVKENEHAQHLGKVAQKKGKYQGAANKGCIFMFDALYHRYHDVVLHLCV